MIIETGWEGLGTHSGERLKSKKPWKTGASPLARGRWLWG